MLKEELNTVKQEGIVYAVPFFMTQMFISYCILNKCFSCVVQYDLSLSMMTASERKQCTLLFQLIFPVCLSFHSITTTFACHYPAKSFTIGFACTSSSLLYFFTFTYYTLPWAVWDTGDRSRTGAGQWQPRVPTWGTCLSACQKPNLTTFTALWKVGFFTQFAEGTLFDICFLFFLVSLMPKATEGFIKARLFNQFSALFIEITHSTQILLSQYRK